MIDIPNDYAGEQIINIYAFDGKLVLVKKLESTAKQEIDISELQPSSYSVKLSSKNDRYVSLLIKE